MTNLGAAIESVVNDVLCRHPDDLLLIESQIEELSIAGLTGNDDCIRVTPKSEEIFMLTPLPEPEDMFDDPVQYQGA